MSKHPNLVRYACGDPDLTVAEIAAIDEHLHSCTECKDFVLLIHKVNTFLTSEGGYAGWIEKIASILEENDWDKEKAAKALGISSTRIREKDESNVATHRKASQTTKTRDGWDKANIIGAILVPIMLAVFTYFYQRAEGKRSEADRQNQIVSALAENEEPKRKLAALRLAIYAPEEALNNLVLALDIADSTVSKAAKDAITFICSLRPSSCGTIIKGLQNDYGRKEPFTRISYAQLLAALCRDNCLPFFYNAIKNEKDTIVFLELVKLLQSEALESCNNISVLGKLLQDRSLDEVAHVQVMETVKDTAKKKRCRNEACSLSTELLSVPKTHTYGAELRDALVCGP